MNERAKQAVSRRAVLRGMGVAMALPWMESLAPRASAAVAGGGPPVRLAFVFMPNGVNYDAWAPSAEGVLSPTLEPLAGVREHLNILTGLTLKRARANGDGPGDHARSSASFLTGRQARKTAGNDIRNGVSVDQVAAAEVGKATRLPSIELGCEHSPSSGSCDSGYSCAYTSNIAWRDESTPLAKVVDPAAAFERLFGDATQAAAAQERLSRRKSILDFVSEDARALSGRLGAADKRKLDQFQTSVREIELRVERARSETTPRKGPGAPAPTGIPDKVGEHMDLMFDMVLLAFQTDTTRVATLMLAVDGSNRSFPELGIREGHHELSHHQNNAEMIAKIRKIDRFHMERFARFVAKMRDAKDGEGGGSLLDSSLVLLGGGISDGNRHNHEDLPILLAGRGGGVKSGRLIRTGKETPLCNLYLSMLDRAGVVKQEFGDSTGAVDL